MIKRDISISDPKFEVENLRYLTVESSYLKGRGDITIFVPPGYENRNNLPIVILLHGVYSSHWAWTRHMNVHNTALEMIQKGSIEPMILVMPSDGLKGGGSGYVKQEAYDFEKWIVEDVVEATRKTIPQSEKNSKLFISGLSMGGYGALRLACKYGSLFDGVTGHSSVLSLKDLRLFIDDGPQMDSNKSENDLSVFQTILNNKGKLPPIQFDCGSEDELISSNRELHQQLINNHIQHNYNEYPGAHTGEYWAKHIKKSFIFFSQLT